MWSAAAKSYMRKVFLIYEEMRKYLTIYEEAVSHIWLCNRSLLNFHIYEENLIFFFISAEGSLMQKLGRTISCCVYSDFNVKITQPLWSTRILISHILNQSTLIFFFSCTVCIFAFWSMTHHRNCTVCREPLSYPHRCVILLPVCFRFSHSKKILRCFMPVRNTANIL